MKIVLALVVVLFSYLAFRGIPRQGILYHDAGVYLLEAKFIDEGFRTLLDLSSANFKRAHFWEEIKQKTNGVPLHSGKPAFNILIWIAGFMAGFDDSISAKVTAVCAILGLILTFLLAKRLFGDRAAVYASVFTASSVFYLVYARSGIAEHLVTVLFLLGLLFYLESRDRFSFFFLFAAGLSLGGAFTANPWRVAYMPVLAVFLDGVSIFLERKWNFKIFLKRVLILFLGFIAPILVFQVPYAAGQMIVGDLPFSDYWTHLGQRGKILVSDVSWFQYQHFTELAEDFWLVDGPFFSFVILAAWVFLIWRWLRERRFDDLFVLAFSLIPFLFFSFNGAAGGGAFPRVASNLIPIAAIAASASTRALEARWGRLVAIGVVIGALALAFPRQIEVSGVRSGYREASQYLKSTGAKKFMILSMEPVWRFYLGKAVGNPYERPTSMKALIERAQGQGIRYLVLDFSSIHSKYGTGYTAELLDRFRPLATFSNPLGGSLPFLLDQYGRVSRDLVKSPWSKQIYIFDIEGIAPLFNQSHE